MDLAEKVRKLIVKEKLIEKGDNVLVGVSGGIDSTVLLNLLVSLQKELPFHIGVAHVNHQLRDEESERDEAFVIDLTRTFSLPCYVKRVDVRGYAKTHGMSLQHAGRDMRYEFFQDIAEKDHYNKIAVAHNADDQVETFILRILKGTGIRGLTSIPVKRDNIIRPLLTSYRSEIEEYAKGCSTLFVEDSSNKKIVYERNFIRKEICPLMERVNPEFREKIIDLLNDLSLINELLNRKAEAFLKDKIQKVEGEVLVQVDTLKAIDEETRFRAISEMLMTMEPRFIPLREHIKLIEKILVGRKPNLSIVLPHHIRVSKTYDTLRFTQKPKERSIEDIFAINYGKNDIPPLNLTLDVMTEEKKPQQFEFDKNVAYFDMDKIGSLSIRTFRNGDRFVPLGMKYSVKLKDFFISLKIPKEKRRYIPLLISEKDIIWVIGYRIDDRYRITDRTQQILKVVAEYH